jgi:integrase
MATMKICVRTQRKDGFWPVYIRVIHNRQVGYLKTDKMVPNQGINKAGEVCDPYVVAGLSKKIIAYMDRLNREDTVDWSVGRVVNFLSESAPQMTFSKYMHSALDRLYNEGRMGTYAYKAGAVSNLEKFVGHEVYFADVTIDLLERWRASIKGKESTKMGYLATIRKMFRDAKDDLNDEMHGEYLVRGDPFKRMEIVRVRPDVKRAIAPKDCRRFFSSAATERQGRYIDKVVARDVCMLSFCLAGINAADLYILKKENYRDGIICYHRHKTMGKREDKAYFEIRVPPIVYPLMEKYAAPPEDEYLFNFHLMKSTSRIFVSCITDLAKSLGTVLSISPGVSFYTFRHTWATYAQNYCGASIADVAFALNHTMKDRITRGYIKLNFEPVWELNEKVIDFVFFQNEDEVEEERAQRRRVYEITPTATVHAALYYRGRKLGEVRGCGFRTEEEIVAQLRLWVDESVPPKAVMQYKIELATGASRVYSLTKE